MYSFKYEEKRPLRRSRRRWENNSRLGIGEMIMVTSSPRSEYAVILYDVQSCLLGYTVLFVALIMICYCRF
jgi:hypothetical protein